jgi:hypothetical protein
MRSDAQNVSVHAVATSLVFDRVPSNHLPDTGSQKPLAECNMKELVSLSDEETCQIRERYKLLPAYFSQHSNSYKIWYLHICHMQTLKQ